MDTEEVRNLRNTIRRVTTIFVTIAIILTGLFFYAFIQLQQKEDRLESYTKKLGGAPVISSDYPLQSTDRLKIEQNEDGYFIKLIDGINSNLNADLLDDKDSTFFTDATNIISGFLSSERFSAWGDLISEGYVVDGKIRSEFLEATSSSGSVDLSGYATQDWVSSQGFLTSYTESDPTLSVWGGSGNINTVGTITSGTWNGSPITSSYIANGTILLEDIAQNSCSNGEILKWNTGSSSWICAVDDAVSGIVDWSTITNRPSGLDDGDDNTQLTEGEVETYIINGAIDLSAGTSVGSELIASQNWVSSQGYITDGNTNWDNSYGFITASSSDNLTNKTGDISQWTNDSGYLTSFTEVDPTLATWNGSININTLGTIASGTWNGDPIISSYISNGTILLEDLAQNGCADGEIIKWNAGSTSWICSVDDNSGAGVVDWTSITNRPAGLDDGDDDTNLAEAEVEAYITNGTIDFYYTSTLGGVNIATQDWVSSQSYLTSFTEVDPTLATWNGTTNIDTVGTITTGAWNGTPISTTYIENGTILSEDLDQNGCTDGQILKWNDIASNWVCADDNNDGSSGSGVTGTTFSNVAISDYVFVSNQTTTSSTYSIINGSEVTFTKYTDDSDVLIDIDLSMYANAANTGAQIAVSDGTTNYDVFPSFINVSSNHVPFSGKRFIEALPAGDYTFSIQWKRTFGSGTLTIDSNDAVIMSVSEVNGAGNTGVYTKWDPDAPPETASSYDDEFEDESFDSAKWSEYDYASTMTIGEEIDGLNLYSLQDSSYAGIYQALPTGDFTVATKVLPNGAHSDALLSGIALYEDPTDINSNLYLFLFRYSNTNGYGFTTQSCTNYNSCSSVNQLNNALTNSSAYLRVRRNASTYYFDISTDGASWQRMASTTLGYTPASFGLVTRNNNTSETETRTVFDFFRYVNSDVGVSGRLNGRLIEVGASGFSSGGTGTPDWTDILNRPAGLDDGDDDTHLTEAEVETYVTNDALDFFAGSTLDGASIATETWVNAQNYLTSSWTGSSFIDTVGTITSGVWNSSIQDGIIELADLGQNGCTDGQIIKWDTGTTSWICSDEATGSGSSSTTVAPQSYFEVYDAAGGDRSTTGIWPGGITLVAVKNVGNDFSLTTNKYTAPVDGLYYFAYSPFSNNSGGRNFLYVNGAAIKQTNGSNIPLTVYIELTTGDTVWMQGQASFPMYWYASAAHTHFYGGLVSNQSELSVTKETLYTEKILYEESLVAPQTSFDIQNIDQTYDKLEFEIEARSSYNSPVENIKVYINNDTIDANYLSSRQYGGSSTNGDLLATARIGQIPALQASANSFGVIEGTVYDYTSTRTKHLISDTSKYSATTHVFQHGLVWDNSSAINRLTFITDTGSNLEVGSKIKLIGIKSTDVVTDVTGSIGGANPDWTDIQNIPADIADGDDDTHLTEGEVEGFITNGVLDLFTGTTIDGSNIATQTWVASQSYLTSYTETDPTLATWSGTSNISTLGVITSGTWNGNAITSAFIEDGTLLFEDIAQNGCTDGQIIKWDTGTTSWICGDDSVSNSLWVDGATYLYPSSGKNLGNSASAGVDKLSSVYLSDSSSVVFGDDNDIALTFDGTYFSMASDMILLDITNGYVGINNPNPLYSLDVVGAVNADQLCLNGDCVSSWADVGGAAGGGQAVSWERAYGTTDISYATAAWADMPDMTITKITGANPVELTFTASVGNDTAKGVTRYRLLIDGVVVGTETKIRTPDASVGPNVSLNWIENVSSGSHEFKVQWYSELGISYNRATAGSEHRTLIIKEFIGGSNGGLGNGEIERAVLSTGDTVGSVATDLTGLTITQELIAGREYEWRFQSTGAKATTGNLYVQVTDGSGNVLSRSVESIPSGYASSQEVVYRETGTGATVTRKIQAYTNTGTYSFYAGSGYSSIFSLDDVTQDSVAVSNSQWQDANLEWYVGGNLVSLNLADSSQRYINNNGVVTINARLVAAAGVNLSGEFTLQNLPVAPLHTIFNQLIGSAEWRNEGTGYYSVRPIYMGTDLVKFRLYNDYQFVSSTINGTESDSINISITYEAAPN